MSDKIKVLGGSVNRNWNWAFMRGRIEASGLTRSGWSKEVKKSYPVRSAPEFSIADEATDLKVFGALGWGSVGVLIAGPVGAIVGGVLGGRGETVTFVAKFHDDATMLGQVPKKVWLKMLAERI